MENQVIKKRKKTYLFSQSFVNRTMIFFIIISSIFYCFTKNIYLFVGLIIPTILFSLYKTVRDEKFAIFVSLFLATEAMGLWPSISLFGGIFSWADIGILWSLFLFILMIIKGRKYKCEKIGILVFVYFTFMIFGSVNAFLIYKQNVLVGMLVFRKTYIYLSIIPIISLIQNKVISKNDVLNEVYKFVKIYTIILFAELALLYIKIPITNYSYSIRWGYRISAPNLPQIVGFLISFYYILNKNHPKNFIWALIFALGFVLINQSRISIIGTVLSTLILFIIFPKQKRKKKIMLFGLALMIILLLIPSIRTIVIDGIKEFNDDNSGNMVYRSYERMYFDHMLKGHEIFGVGIPNMNNGRAALYSGKLIQGEFNGYWLSGAFTSDLGLYAVRYYFGIVGYITIWTILIVSLITNLKNFVINRKNNLATFVVLGIILYFIITSNTLNGLFEQPVEYLLLFLIGASLEGNKFRRKKHNQN